jgi:hypothetical protein
VGYVHLPAPAPALSAIASAIPPSILLMVTPIHGRIFQASYVVGFKVDNGSVGWEGDSKGTESANGNENGFDLHFWERFERVLDYVIS